MRAPSTLHHVDDPTPTTFTWTYEAEVLPSVDRLYDRGKRLQWNAEDLPWDTEVDEEAVVVANAAKAGATSGGWDVSGTPLASWGPEEFLRLAVENERWTMSQFLHGEQGALLCTAKIVQSVPWMEAKTFASTQVLDEARHVEAFSRYLDTKLGGHYPINPHLGALLDDIVGDSRWDITYLGMQIMVEGLALAGFGVMAQTTEPLLARMLRLIMADEARHVAFGVLSLREVYVELTDAELRERQEFVLEAAVRMSDRLLQQEVWERMDVSLEDVTPLIAGSPERAAFRANLFSNIVPNCRRLGLLDASGGWLRRRFDEMGILQFASTPDTLTDLGLGDPGVVG